MQLVECGIALGNKQPFCQAQPDLLQLIPIDLMVIRVFNLSISLVMAVGLSSSTAADSISFNRDIRPILSDKCYQCHGPDTAQRQANLRFDLAEAALDSGVISPGEPDSSELLRRITSADPDEQMPPPDSNLTLSKTEIELLRHWVSEGAHFQKHWAFLPLTQVTEPNVDEHLETWIRNPIDSFVGKRLAEKGPDSAPVATREELIRRVSFDLAGLPPSLQEVDAFLADTADDAYDRVVQRLLDSPHFGERMAREWLDLARYAETHGYQSDDYRPTWPWRDWVIKAINQNMPFDQFVTWQLAGDLMLGQAQPSPTGFRSDLLPAKERDKLVATTFNRNHAQNSEGGIVLEEFRVEYVADRAQTFATAFLGMTLQCSRCHDHKFDPISQREFYQLFSFFNNVPESGQITWHQKDVPGPTLLLPNEEEEKQLVAVERSIVQAENDLQSYRESRREALVDWLSEYRRRETQKVEDTTTQKLDQQFSTWPGLVAYCPLDSISDQKIHNRVGLDGQVIDLVTNKVADARPDVVQGVVGQAVKLNGDDSLAFPGANKSAPGVANFHRAQPFSIGLWISIPQSLTHGVIFHSNRGGTLYTFKGYQVSVEDGYLDVRLAHDFPADSLHLVSETHVPKDRWIQLVLTYDGSSRAAGVTVYLDGQPLAMQIRRDHLTKDIIFRLTDDRSSKGTPEPSYLKIGGRWRSKGFSDGFVDEIVVFQRELSSLEVDQLWHIFANQDSPTPSKLETILSRNGSDLDETSREQLLDYYLSRFDKEYANRSQQLKRLRTRQAELVEPILELMVMEDMTTPRQSYLLTRGAYDAPAEGVEPGTPASIFEFPPHLPPNRLGLARWLFLPDNPLTARVAVNRYWQLLFGQGIVATPEDFGSQGSLPTHPELLDWLAGQFIRSGWNVKELCRLIVSSATYRQTSDVGPAVVADDPQNIWLARGPSGRLTAEQIRDNALTLSGLLTRDIGGPSVMPYQPEGLWSLNSMSGKYVQAQGDELYRRSLYTYWKRTIPPPSMNTFDAPNRSYCVVKRESTTTPLQALVLLNDVQFVEAARAMAEQLTRQYLDVNFRLVNGFRLATGRRPTAQEQETLENMYAQQLNYFQSDSEKAVKFLSLGESSCGEDLPKTEFAATAVVISAILNLTEAVSKP